MFTHLDTRSSDWRRSSFCNSGACVEVQFRTADGVVCVRDSKFAEGQVLTFDMSEWRAFLAGVHDLEFEV